MSKYREMFGTVVESVLDESSRVVKHGDVITVDGKFAGYHGKVSGRGSVGKETPYSTALASAKKAHGPDRKIEFHDFDEYTKRNPIKEDFLGETTHYKDGKYQVVATHPIHGKRIVHASDDSGDAHSYMSQRSGLKPKLKTAWSGFSIKEKGTHDAKWVNEEVDAPSHSTSKYREMFGTVVENVLDEAVEPAAKKAFSMIHDASGTKPDEESHKKKTPQSVVKHSMTYHASSLEDAHKKMEHLHKAISSVHKHTRSEKIPGIHGEVHSYKSAVNGKKIEMSHVATADHDGNTHHHVVVTHNY